MRALVETGIPRATWDRLGSVTTRRPRSRRGTSRRVLAIPYLDVAGDPARGSSRSRWTACAAPAATIMPALLERLGCEVAAINMEPDGRFPRPPEPIAENLGELEALVQESGRGHRVRGGS